MEKEKLI